MLVRACAELVGADVLAADGRFGIFDDLYFDLDWWEAWYVVVSTDQGLVLPFGCVESAAPARRCVTLGLTRAQLQPRVWPMKNADWLGELCVCSVRAAVGWSIVAEDGPAGTVADLLVDLPSRRVAYVVASLERPGGVQRVLLPPEWLEANDAPPAPLRVQRTRAQLSSAPGIGVLSLLPERG